MKVASRGPIAMPEPDHTRLRKEEVKGPGADFHAVERRVVALGAAKARESTLRSQWVSVTTFFAGRSTAFEGRIAS
jgi:hypothetical protein